MRNQNIIKKRLEAALAPLNEYNTAGLSFKEAAERLKVSTPTVMQYAKRLNIKWNNYRVRGPYRKANNA